MSDSETKTYRVRQCYGEWFVRIFNGWDYKNHIEDFGPFSFKEAIDYAKNLDMPDGDKGIEMAHVRGYHNVR